MKNIKAPHWLLAAICAVFSHQWRSDSNIRKHCHRCGEKRKRAVYEWERWVKDGGR